VLLRGRVEGDSYLPEYLEAGTVEQIARLGDPKADVAPLVMLNACQAGRLGHQLTSLGGFAQAFLGRGAGAFVSRLWSVGDEPARTFTEAFYSAPLAGETLSEGSIAARAAAREAGEATWLAYVVYGNPCATITLG
jgi:CHAT domain-containing protein